MIVTIFLENKYAHLKVNALSVWKILIVGSQTYQNVISISVRDVLVIVIACILKEIKMFAIKVIICAFNV